jgi:serine phosphatase RsbU (regulator of sigma subunit)
MGYFLSAFCGLLDFSKGKLTYSNYGHPPQMLLQSSGSNIVLMKSQTFLMGIGMDAGNVFSTEINFRKGDRLVLFTDGIIEAKSPEGELFGNGRLEDFAKKNSALGVSEFNNKLVEKVEKFQAGEQHDDIFLLTVQTKAQ